jgi:hypothetical protein
VTAYRELAAASPDRNRPAFAQSLLILVSGSGSWAEGPRRCRPLRKPPPFASSEQGGGGLRTPALRL